MEVEELNYVTSWVKREIEERGVLQRYQELFNILQRSAQPNQQKAPFEVQKDGVLALLRQIDLAQLNNQQLELLESLGVAGLVGKRGIAHLEDILFRNNLDIATAAKKVQDAMNQIGSAVTWATEVGARLQQHFRFAPVDPDGALIVRVTFTGGAQFRNVKDFKEWGLIWFDIGRGLAMAHGLTPEDVMVVGASRGSIIIELATRVNVVETIGAILLLALAATEKVCAIRKQIEEIRGLKLDNDRAVKILEEEATKSKAASIELITAEVIESISTETKNGEITNVVSKSVKNLVSFVASGGEVDCVVPEDADSTKPGDGDAETQGARLAKLRNSFQEIRRLEQQLKRIEHHPD
jgi:hypothetical protein